VKRIFKAQAPPDTSISPADFELGSIESRAAARALAESLDRSTVRLSVSCVCHPELAKAARFVRLKGGIAFRNAACPFDLEVSRG
jgi:hypothetical protein